MARVMLKVRGGYKIWRTLARTIVLRRALRVRLLGAGFWRMEGGIS
jgi:hypothetical protein